MLFLKTVIAVIENEKYKDAVEQLGEKLKLQGIEFVCLCTGDCLTEPWGCANALHGAAEALYEPAKVTHGAAEGGSTENAEDNDVIPPLWLTDSAICVNFLHDKGHAVLAFLHEDNRRQDFSSALYACEEPQELDAEYMDRVFRRYMRLPWDILQTERCFVRETVPEDAEAFYKIYSEPSVTKYTEGVSPEIEQERRYINDYIDKIYSFYDCGVWTIVKNDTDEVIGRAGFSFREGYEEPEIGFVIGIPWQKQGYAEEVCKAILQYGWDELGFTTIQAFVKPGNRASLALCKKLGLQEAGEVYIEKEVYWRLVRSMDAMG